MANLLTVFKKELADHFGSKRFILLFILIIVLATVSAYQGATYLKNNAANSGSMGSLGFRQGFASIFTGGLGGLPFTALMVYFGPILGLSLGFDAISKERASGSLSVLLSQPIFRDAVINGKFLAGLAALSLVAASTIGIMTGIAIPIVGFGPTATETTSIIVFTFLTIVYLGFWLALGVLFSTVFKKTATSIIAAVATWIVFSFVISLLASLIATAIVPVQSFQSFRPTVGNQTGGYTVDQSQMQQYQQSMQARQALIQGMQSVSPSFLYTQAAQIIFTGRNVYSFSSSMPNPPVESSWPQFTALGVGMVICFVMAYILFLRREIRPGG